MWVRVAASSTPVDCTVASHVAGAATDTADDVRCKVTLLRTVVLAVTYTTAVLANLVFVVAQRAVKSGKLAQLVTLVVVLTFGSRGSLHDRIQYDLPHQRAKDVPFR